MLERDAKQRNATENRVKKKMRLSRTRSLCEETIQPSLPPLPFDNPRTVISINSLLNPSE